MPGWYIHLDVARKALAALPSNVGAAAFFNSNGPSAAELTRIAKANPAYAALGAIGPDFFFLFPDFTPPMGTGMSGAANTIRDYYTWWDDNFLGPYEELLGPIGMNTGDELGAATGGLSNQLSSIASIASRVFGFLSDTAVVLIGRSYDVFGLMSSGVQKGYDEQVFFWSDMLHYRKTYEFAAHLWQKARKANNEQLQAFALGWMSHLATDVTGHCFVNEKCGGSYRLHWQRHHLVENHMDARVYDSEFGNSSIYQMLASSALHLWIAFNPDGSSRVDFFADQPGPDYPPGDDTPSILGRNSIWDFDSNMPDALSTFIAEALVEIYNPETTNVAGVNGQCADHPTIWEAVVPGSNGYPQTNYIGGDGFPQNDISATYWWLYHYLKYTTTHYYKIRAPDAPNLILIPPFPSPPGAGEADPGPGASDPSHCVHLLECLLAIFAWIEYLAQVAIYLPTVLLSVITSFATYPIREILYNVLELPLYNAWLALNHYLSITAFTAPLKMEISPGLNTLGVSFDDGVWKEVQKLLDLDDGGLLSPIQPNLTEPVLGGPSGCAFTPLEDVVADPPGFVAATVGSFLHETCGSQELPSEFLRPWRWPLQDNQGDPVPKENPLTSVGPYSIGQDATVLLRGLPGNATIRQHYENAQNEAETKALLFHGTSECTSSMNLGDATDYTGYVVARLTRDNPGPIANFNLDADRGYGYLCWDWLRDQDQQAVPYPFSGFVDERRYNVPVAPGTGWCNQDLRPPGPGNASIGTSHSVQIRYIDRENKFK